MNTSKWIATLPTSLMVSAFHHHAFANENSDGNGRPKVCDVGGVLRTRVSSQHNKYGLRIDIKNAIPSINQSLKQVCPDALELEAEVRTRAWPQIIENHLKEFRDTSSAQDPRFKNVSDMVVKEIAERVMGTIIRGAKDNTTNKKIEKFKVDIEKKTARIAEIENLTPKNEAEEKKLVREQARLVKDVEKLKAEHASVLSGEDIESEDSEEEDTRTNNALALGYGEREAIFRICQQVIMEMVNRPEDVAKNKNGPVAFADDLLKEKMKGVNLTKKGQTMFGPNIQRLLTGNMPTTDLLITSTPTLAMAHSYSVNESRTTLDYITATDDMANLAGSRGAALVTELELAMSYQLFTFMSWDVREFAKTLHNDFPNLGIQGLSTIIEGVTDVLLTWAAQRGHGSRAGSTAPFAWANLLVVETTNAQTVRHDEAFVVPVARKNVIQESHNRLADALQDFDMAYPGAVVRAAMVGPDVKNTRMTEVATVLDFPRLKTWTVNQVTGRDPDENRMAAE